MSGFSVYGSAAGRYAAEVNIRKIYDECAAKTMVPDVLTATSGFCGRYAPYGEDENGAVIVTSTDGVGSKLKLAGLMNKNDLIGIDCVALTANDVVSSGARPIFFSNYLSMGKRKPELIEEILNGIAEGCTRAGCSLLAGEISDNPGTYSNDEYDLAGFCVGVAERKNIIDCSQVKKGDALVALGSSGLHSDGYASAMRILRVTENNIRIYLNDLGKTLGEELMTPSKIYVKSVLRLLETCRPNGIANITGGGLYHNVPRIIPEGLCAHISRARLRVPPIYSVIRSMNNVDDGEMFRTFNMGVGMMLAVSADKADETVSLMSSFGEEAYIIGEVTENENKIEIE